MQVRTVIIVGALLAALLTLSACSSAEPTPAATALPAAATTAADTPEATAVVDAPPTATPAPAATATPIPTTPQGQVAALLYESLKVTKPATDSIGLEGAYAFQLETNNDRELWLAHTLGIRNFDPLQNHVLAIYEKSGESWKEVTRVELAMRDNPEDPGVSPDYLGEEGVTQIQVEPSHIWIQVEGGAGAHSGVYGLFRFDGTAFKEEISSFSASPGVGHSEDLNNDGIAEVLLDASDPYVFCYACGVRLVNWAIERWDGTQMISVTLSALSDSAPAEVSTFNQNLLALANAGLWKDVLATLETSATFSYTEPALEWNLIYARLNAEARRDAAANQPAYPLLTHLFYGDYDAVLEILQGVGAEGLFSQQSPLIVGTPAEGWEPTLADWIVNTVDPALALNPDLATAYFLRGWSAYIREYNAAAGLPDVQKAAELAPTEALFSQSVELLSQ